MRPTGTLLIIILLAASAMSGCRKQAPSGPAEEKVVRSYSKSIERIYANEFERALIDSAEAAYPPRDSVLAAASTAFRQHIPETGYWFYRSIDQVLIPFALTVDAVNYYSSMIDAMEDGATHQFIHSAKFKYKASVTFEEVYELHWPEEWDIKIRQMYVEISGYTLPADQFERVYVVKMVKDWDHGCGDDCALWSSIVRIVIFDESLNIVKIYFDGAWWIPIVS